MAWSGPYERRDDHERNWLPGPRQLHEAGPGTTWRPVPLRGIEHECAERRHRINVVERDLWEMIRILPAGRNVLLLPARAPVPAAGPATPEEAQQQAARELATRPWPSRRAADRAVSIPR